MRYVGCLILATLALCACERKQTPPAQGNTPGGASEATEAPPDAPKRPLVEERRGFTTKLVRQGVEEGDVPVPPDEAMLRLVRFDAPVGKLAAYVSIPAEPKARNPAIVWLFGGLSNGIDEAAWEPADPSDDQSAVAFRQAGIVTMYPSYRGGPGNPGHKEGYFCEVDDVIAAAEWLAKQDYVDPQRIYLGGHSTGGTLALLVAECSPRFRAVFAFGPVGSVADYNDAELGFNLADPRECRLRAPSLWLNDIVSPTFVFEGALLGNARAVRHMSTTCRNPLVHFYLIPRGGHFNILAPATRLIAQKVMDDTGPVPGISFIPAEMTSLKIKQR